MSRRVCAWSIVFVGALMLALAGCAQKDGAQMESAQVQKDQKVQAESQQQETAAAAEKKKSAAEEETVEEYGVSEEKAEEEKEKEEEGLKQEARQALKKRIHFTFDSSELSKQAQETLKAKAKILKKNPELGIVIEGHCDERGTDEYNMALGERRARAAYEYLILLGVDADRMNLVSYGEERPMVEGDNEEAWAKNRRDEFRIKQ